MKLRGPQSLNQLILVGFGLVALPLLVAVVWALVNLDRLASQSEQLVTSGVTAAENNRQLVELVGTLDRVSRQYQILGNTDSLAILNQDLASLQSTLDDMRSLAAQADAEELVNSVGVRANRIVNTLTLATDDADLAQGAIAEFAGLRQSSLRLTTILRTYIENELSSLQESTRRAQQISTWQTAALIPGTIILVLFFTLLVARPIRQIDRSIAQLGQSGF